MKVAVVHNLIEGGAWRRLSSQLQYLECEVVEVTLSTSKPITSSAVVVPLDLRASGSVRWLRPALRYIDLARIVAAYGRVSELLRLQRPDVVWLNPCQYFQAPMVRAPASVPIVYYCDEPRRSDYEREAKLSTRPSTRLAYGPMRSFERSADRRTVARVQTIVTNSEFTVGRIERAYGRSATLVRCGVSSFFSPRGGAEVPEDAPILSVGTLIPSKGHDIVIRAAACAGLARPVVVVAPRDPGGGEAARLRDLASTVGVTLDIRIAVADEELRDLYRRSYATLYLARDEPFGLASIEAQASGCPVIVSDTGGLPETVEQGTTGWAVPRVAERAAELLVRLGDSLLRTEMACAAASRGASFTWEGSARAMHTILEQAMR